jgi:hypothetical protein
LGLNEIYARLRLARATLARELTAIASDDTDYKALIARANDMSDKLSLAQALATRRLARGLIPELDACFAALQLIR